MEVSPGVRLLLDFVNTYDVESGVYALPSFLASERLAGLGPAAPAVELWEGLRAVLTLHTEPSGEQDAVAGLNALLGAAPLTVRLDAHGGAELVPVPGLRGAAGLTALVAAAVAGACADGSWARVKACSMENCRWVYFDRSPAGRRRWCDMAVCGSRAKMRAYRAAKRGQAGPPGATHAPAGAEEAGTGGVRQLPRRGEAR
ncbi:CGNR zinc finger domain-containing protein [Micromonospora halophytica]|uniref:Conserved protein containing a Zn-ribbon-like motif, possibly RNA-binding n=1 Tax=Micromonospora halophytica TaxID=47864 RepID=A0A1C5JFM4_9ACTN|nr:CGNR zinc finger domain-containing protein [Micromonospora halophytica]SCG69308.1 Conserved protein containing a Zn-ribbon-like motif, possibly RNA-binding [Micromonospora halophytica]